MIDRIQQFADWQRYMGSAHWVSRTLTDVVNTRFEYQDTHQGMEDRCLCVHERQEFDVSRGLGVSISLRLREASSLRAALDCAFSSATLRDSVQRWRV